MWFEEEDANHETSPPVSIDRVVADELAVLELNLELLPG